jgi:hypothetical protein
VLNAVATAVFSTPSLTTVSPAAMSVPLRLLAVILAPEPKLNADFSPSLIFLTILNSFKPLVV